MAQLIQHERILFAEKILRSVKKLKSYKVIYLRFIIFLYYIINRYLYIIFRFGACFSPMLSLTAEFCHNGIRDRVIVFQGSFASIAAIVIALISWSILTNDWRMSMFNGKFGKIPIIYLQKWYVFEEHRNILIR